eukprot:2934144-Amphidinium_carterae.1
MSNVDSACREGRYSAPQALKSQQFTTLLSLEVREVVLAFDLACLPTTIKTLQVGLMPDHTLMRTKEKRRLREHRSYDPNLRGLGTSGGSLTRGSMRMKKV